MSPKAPRWNLDTIFPGGAESKEFAEFRKKIKAQLEELNQRFDTLPKKLDDSNLSDWTKFVLSMQDLLARIGQAGSYNHCLISADVNDEKAQQINGEIDIFQSEYEKLEVKLESFAKLQDDPTWQKFIADERISEVSFYLNEVREIAKKKMPPEFESLAADLAVNGYHAWNRLYDKMYGLLKGKMTVESGETRELSLGQLANKMTSPDRDIRRRAHEQIEAAWESRAAESSMSLNFMAGFRLTLYGHRQWDVLFQPLKFSRITEDTLNAMWDAVAQSKDKINRYVDAKKKILNIKNFRWYDQSAPVGEIDKTYTFEEAGNFIVDKIATFSKEQAEFTRMALDKKWVEAEDRSGKAGGAFCTDFDIAKESRVFMTYGGSFDNLSTLAHELGHAFHQGIVQQFQPFARIYPMTLAETASIFNEFLITDAAYKEADSKDEKLMLLDVKLQNALALFCNINARYLFDRTFYEKRKEGLLTRQEIDEIMVDSQKKAFMGTLADDGYHPLFWCSKLHFFLTDAPFYNFPYTFGYLFASGVYNRAQEEGPSFAENYKALLADTGRMSSEDVAKKHMGVDLTKPDFWVEAVNRVMSDLDEFEKLI